MRKLYSFLLVVLALTGLSLSARAQTYAMTDYLVRTDNTPWSQISGTTIPIAYPYYYYMVNNIQVPFTFRCLNFTTNLVHVNANGDVSMSPTWAQYNYTYDFDAYQYYSGAYNYGTAGQPE